jgi:non-specific serine/threonine protein kinase
MDVPESFGDVLRRHRIDAGLSQEQLAELAGLSPHGISDLERGARQRPYRDTVRRLANSLKLEGTQLATLVAAAGRSKASTAPPQPSRRGPLLPIPPTPLIGRETQLGQLRARLLDQNARLLTLTGTGGSGKTRLALHLASQLVDEFTDGIWLAEIAPLGEATTVAQTVASLFQIEGKPGHELLEILTKALAKRKLLLVLDNCEHLVDACAELCEGLLGECPDVRILATSRELLRVSGESAWRVSPLRVPDITHPLPTDELARVPSVQLFLERAQAARPDFQLDDANAGAVAKVCARLDGLPLALELAAARTRVLSAEQVLDHLQDMFRLLAGGSRTAPGRQQTVRATLDWSHSLLTPAEQMLFRRMAIFAGGCDLAAVEAVCSTGSRAECVAGLTTSDVLDLLTQLVDKSLVDVAESGGVARYRMLEPVRQYAWLHLEASGERVQLAERHADTYLERAETAEASLNRGAWGGELQSLGRDLDNVRAALTWCRSAPERVERGLRLASALWRFWDSSGHMGEGRRWLGELLAQPSQCGPTPTVGRAKALYAAGFLALLQEGLEAARDPTAESLALWEQLGDERWLGWTRCLDGLIWRFRDPARAVQRGQEALAAAGLVGDEILRRGALYLLGEARRLQGDLDAAFRLLQEARMLMTQNDDRDPRITVYILRSLGQVATQRGDYKQAADILKERLAISNQMNDHWNLPDAVESLAWVATAQRLPQRATRLYGAAEALRQLGGSPMLGELKARRERRLLALRQALGETEFATAWQAGRVLSVDQAVALALEDSHASSLANAQSTRPSNWQLSPREREVAVLLAHGHTNRQIAEALVISQRTATVHVQHILAKLDVRSRWQVAERLAMRAV